MDDRTIRLYDEAAAEYAADWEDDQPPPEDLYAILREHFTTGPTADIGCGSGRDTAWLCENGYDTVGFDASDGLIAEAKRRHPGVRFEKDALPALETLSDGAYANILCETVIMHLPPDEVGAAVTRMAALLAPGGTLYLSWRMTQGENQRDKSGRLYAAFDKSAVMDALASMDILMDERIVSKSSGRVIHRVVARKAS